MDTVVEPFQKFINYGLYARIKLSKQLALLSSKISLEFPNPQYFPEVITVSFVKKDGSFAIIRKYFQDDMLYFGAGTTDSTTFIILYLTDGEGLLSGGKVKDCAIEIVVYPRESSVKWPPGLIQYHFWSGEIPPKPLCILPIMYSAMVPVKTLKDAPFVVHGCIIVRFIVRSNKPVSNFLIRLRGCGKELSAKISARPHKYNQFLGEFMGHINQHIRSLKQGEQYQIYCSELEGPREVKNEYILMHYII